MSKLKRMQRAFDRAVPLYDTAAVLPREVAQRMIARLDLVTCEPKVGLELGTRTGENTAALQARFPEVQWIAAECSPAMLALARQKSAAVQWVCADPLSLPIMDASVDILIAHALLPGDAWAQALRECRRVLKPGGLCMFSTLGPDSLHELRQSWSGADAVSPFEDMHLIGDALMATGFENPVMDIDYFILRYTSVLHLLRELKALGSYAAPLFPGLGTKREWARRMSAYKQYCTPEGKYPATFEVVYGHAWAAVPKVARPAGEVTVPVSALRRG